ncbi:MAG: hypothetical protein ACOYW7_11095 [Nitrospirota bacterium]
MNNNIFGIGNHVLSARGGAATIYLTTEELSQRIKYDPRYIRERLKDKVFKKDVHYIKPFGGRKILYVWNEIEKILAIPVREDNPMEGIKLRRVK